jgi:hypothetical protein
MTLHEHRLMQEAEAIRRQRDANLREENEHLRCRFRLALERQVEEAEQRNGRTTVGHE